MSTSRVLLLLPLVLVACGTSHRFADTTYPAGTYPSKVANDASLWLERIKVNKHRFYAWIVLDNRGGAPLALQADRPFVIRLGGQETTPQIRSDNNDKYAKVHHLGQPLAVPAKTAMKFRLAIFSNKKFGPDFAYGENGHETWAIVVRLEQGGEIVLAAADVPRAATPAP